MKKPLIIGLAFVVAIVSAFFLNVIVIHAAGGAPTPVFEATQPLSATQLLVPADVQEVRLPAKDVPPGAITNPSELANQYTLHTVQPGQIIQSEDLTTTPYRDGLAQGRVLFELPVSAATADNATAGSRVDVYVTLNNTVAGQTQPTVLEVMSGVQVLTPVDGNGAPLTAPQIQPNTVSNATAVASASTSGTTATTPPAALALDVTQPEAELLHLAEQLPGGTGNAAGAVSLVLNPWETHNQFRNAGQRMLSAYTVNPNYFFPVVQSVTGSGGASHPGSASGSTTPASPAGSAPSKKG